MFPWLMEVRAFWGFLSERKELASGFSSWGCWSPGSFWMSVISAAYWIQNNNWTSGISASQAMQRELVVFRQTQAPLLKKRNPSHRKAQPLSSRRCRSQPWARAPPADTRHHCRGSAVLELRLPPSFKTAFSSKHPTPSLGWGLFREEHEGSHPCARFKTVPMTWTWALEIKTGHSLSYSSSWAVIKCLHQWLGCLIQLTGSSHKIKLLVPLVDATKSLVRNPVGTKPEMLWQDEGGRQADTRTEWSQGKTNAALARVWCI